MRVKANFPGVLMPGLRKLAEEKQKAPCEICESLPGEAHEDDCLAAAYNDVILNSMAFKENEESND